jgi:hypothetical protein
MPFKPRCRAAVNKEVRGGLETKDDNHGLLLCCFCFARKLLLLLVLITHARDVSLVTAQCTGSIL